jgi:transcriptional regulator with XRE-family HTH domain
MYDWYASTDNEIMMEWGARLRLARIERNLTQQVLADKTGLNRTTIRDLEHGKSVNTLSIIAVLRGLSLLESMEGMLAGKSESPYLDQMQQNRKRVRLKKK